MRRSRNHRRVRGCGVWRGEHARLGRRFARPRANLVRYQAQRRRRGPRRPMRGARASHRFIEQFADRLAEDVIRDEGRSVTNTGGLRPLPKQPRSRRRESALIQCLKANNCADSRPRLRFRGSTWESSSGKSLPTFWGDRVRVVGFSQVIVKERRLRHDKPGASKLIQPRAGPNAR